MKFVKLDCPSCGSNLEINENTDQFACGYCGKSSLVKREGGIVTLDLVTKEIKKININTDRTSSELAMVRLEKEMTVLNRSISEVNETGCLLGGAYWIAFLGVIGIFMGEFEGAIPSLILGGAIIYFSLNMKKSLTKDDKSLLAKKYKEFQKHKKIVKE